MNLVTFFSQIRPESDPPQSDGWPDMGTIEFRDYRTRYREGLDLVLKGVTFSIGPGEKVYVS